jgi:hypothetical protein
VCEVTPTPLNITMVKIKNGSQKRGYVRYPNKKDTLKESEERGKTSWETPPTPPTPLQGTMYVKKEELQLLGNCVLDSKTTL